MEVAAAAGESVRFRNAEDPEPQEPYIEIAPPEADPYLPRFSVFERVQITPNLVLNVPAPEEIAASKLAFADRVIRVKDLQDINFIRKKFGVTQDQILRKIFGIEVETHRRCAIMNWNQLDRLISEIPQRKAELEKHMSLVDDLEQKRQIEAESEGQEEEGKGVLHLNGNGHRGNGDPSYLGGIIFPRTSSQNNAHQRNWRAR